MRNTSQVQTKLSPDTKYEVKLFCGRVSSSYNSHAASRWRLTQSHCLPEVTQACVTAFTLVSLIALVLGFLLSNLVCPSRCVTQCQGSPVKAQCQQQPWKPRVCVCVFDTRRLVMSEWRHNVYSFYLPSKHLASALVETFFISAITFYQFYHTDRKRGGLSGRMLLGFSGVAVLTDGHFILMTSLFSARITLFICDSM